MMFLLMQDGQFGVLNYYAVLLGIIDPAKPILGNPATALAGLMLADKTAGLEDQLRAMEERAELAERVATHARANQERVEVPVMPQGVVESLARLADEADALADRVEERLAG